MAMDRCDEPFDIVYDDGDVERGVARQDVRKPREGDRAGPPAERVEKRVEQRVEL